MIPKTILLSLNEIASNNGAIAATQTLAKMFNAHVTGFYVIPGAQIYPVAGMDAPPQVYNGNRTFFEQSKSLVKDTFEKAMNTEGLSFDFQDIEAQSSQISESVIEAARNSELVVMVPSQEGGGSGFESDFAERVVMRAGRPILLLPTNFSGKLSLDQIAVAWDGGREAARATFDAMPLLALAKNVKVFGVDEAQSGTEPEAEIAKTLARHNINTEITHVASVGMNIGETLLRAASDHGAGLLVMGAYGHNRITEFIFGGATRHVMRHITMPVLMSH